MDREAWRAAVHGVTKSRTRLSDWTELTDTVLSRVWLLTTPQPAACPAPLSTGILQARILEWVAMPPPGDLPNPGIEPRSPAVQVDSLRSEAPGKPKNTGVGSLSLPQGILPTQESNQGSCIAGGFFTS